MDLGTSLLIVIGIACILLISLLIRINIRKKQGKKPEGKKVKTVGRLTKLLTISIIILFSLYVFLLALNIGLVQEEQNLEDTFNTKNQELANQQDNLEGLEYKLLDYENSLYGNNSELIDLKSGDKYNLHDPIWDEVLDFLNDNEYLNIEKIIESAKNQGLRCAYVEVGLEGDIMLELIGFNTLDYGMTYIEPSTYYLVYPEVGLNYFDCVEDQPYGSSVPEDNDIITEVLIIW